STALLTGSAATSAALTGTNTITGLGDFTATTGFSLTDTPALSVTGAVNGGSVTGTTVDLTGASISTSGSVNGPASIDLVATSGGIGETGSVSTALLTGSAATSAALTGANTIPGLGDFTATTGFSLTDTPALSVTGAVNGGTNVTLTDAGALGIGGSVTGTTVDLTGAAM